MNKINIVLAIAALIFLSSCLKTRAELGEGYQSQVYSKKQAENQASESTEIVRVDEKDELIRTLNGRVEALENQISQMQKQQLENTDAQKVQILQESVIKMESQVAKLEAELADARATKSSAPAAQSSDAQLVNNKPANSSKAKTSFDIAQEYFAKKDFKNAILEYQKFVDGNSKSKSKLIPEAKYKIGLSFESMGLKDEAQSFYEEVAAQHGNTEFGKKAKQKVTKTKK